MSNYRGSRTYTRVRVCQFCTDKNIEINYKDINLLQRYTDDTGKNASSQADWRMCQAPACCCKGNQECSSFGFLPYVNK